MMNRTCEKAAADQVCEFCTDISAAVIHDHVKCLKYYHTKNQDWPQWVSVSASMYPSIEVLQYLCENGCPWHPQTTFYAAYVGCLDALKICFNNHCPWDPMTAKQAARKGHILCLKWIYENCGDVATWDINNLEDFETDELINEETKEYLRSVADSWKNGDNNTTWIKPAK